MDGITLWTLWVRQNTNPPPQKSPRRRLRSGQRRAPQATPQAMQKFAPSLVACVSIFVFVMTDGHPTGGGTELLANLINQNVLSKKDGNVLEILRNLVKNAQNCGIKRIPDMKRVFLKNTTVTCNDGSPSGYYIRKSHGSHKWIVFLEGGWYCFDKASCAGRWMNMRKFMTSAEWPETRKGRGILSWDPEDNPHYFHSNVVLIPYCSSDSWSGTHITTRQGEFSFMGSLIVKEVIRELIGEGLSSTKKLLLVGSSAGGTGVLVNLDSVTDLMAELAPEVEVRGISDSGWFLDNDPFKPTTCSDAHICSPIEAIKRGMELWSGEVPKRCAERFPNDRWRCYFGYNIYSTLQTPVFVIQHLFDEAQITADNVGPPVHPNQWQYIHKVGDQTKKSLHNVSAVFATACLSHMVLTRSDWQNLVIGDISLPNAIKCWEHGHHEPNHHKIHAKTRSDSLQGDDPNHSNRRRNYGRKRRRHNRRKFKGKNRRRDARSLINRHEQHHWDHHRHRCKHHLVDTCAWPQCNLSCPKIRNPFTGEEMDFIDLLMQFGLDLSSIANALGMDLQTLMSMDHDVLLQMLIQQN
ncbi:palmitoleoyl-protein carboxylesterase notum1-like [Tubulanus polymorphus]|uniref:palmitoleoyl-protein carboxylesterase notum1-like n=1 Tax=Tubulanus polymorphus TaxID=672921 RepID=UPI003DA29B72